MITLWGSRKSGKTVFLIALYHAVLRSNRGWQIMSSDQHSTKFITERREEMAVNHVFPRDTDPEDKNRIFKFDIRISKRFFRVKDIRFEFLDPAGEFFENPGMDATVGNHVFENIKKSRGLICLIDPERPNKNEYFRLLLSNFTAMRDKFFPDGGFNPIPIRMAICITKMDQDNKFIYDPVNFDARGYAEELMGDDCFRLLPTYLSSYKFFAVTSMGLDKDGKPNVHVGEDGFLHPSGPPNPINVFEPIEWLLGNG